MTFSRKFSVSLHVDELLTKCSQLLFHYELCGIMGFHQMLYKWRSGLLS